MEHRAQTKGMEKKEINKRSKRSKDLFLLGLKR